MERLYTMYLKVGIISSTVGILLVIVNYFTGFINSTITVGASVIILSVFTINLANMINVSNRRKSKKY